jgi:hypothetical protein
MLPGHGGYGRPLSGNELDPELGGGYGYGRSARAAGPGVPMGFGMPQQPPSSLPANMDPSSPTFDPSARTRTQSSYNFRQSVLNNNAIAKAKSAATAQARATQRAQAGVQGPAEMNAAGMGPGVPAGMGAAAPAAPYSPGGAGDDSLGFAPAPGTQATAPTGVPAGMPNPYAGFQGPGTTFKSMPAPPAVAMGHFPTQQMQGSYDRSGLTPEQYWNRESAMHPEGRAPAPARIHATVTPEQAINLKANSGGRDDQRFTPVGDGTGNVVVDRYVGPGVPSGYGPQQQAQDLATAQYREAQAAGQMQLAGNADPAARSAGLAQADAATNLTNAQAGAVQSGAETAVTDARGMRQENETLRRENRLYQQQGAKSAANWRPPSGAQLKVLGDQMMFGDPQSKAKAKAQYDALMDDWQQHMGGGEQQGGGAAPANPTQGAAGKPLDKDTANTFLQQAGGDKNKARELARQAGYTF